MPLAGQGMLLTAIGIALGLLAASAWQRPQLQGKRDSWTRRGMERRNQDGGRAGSTAFVEGSGEYSSIPTT